MDEQTLLGKLEDIFRDTFTKSQFDFSIDTDRDDIEEWTSLNQIRLLTAIEEEFSISFDLSEIESLTDVDSLVTTLRPKVAI